MNRAQPQYMIEANRSCKTHRRGTQIVYTGPKSGVGSGWTVLYRVWQYQDRMCGLV